MLDGILYILKEITVKNVIIGKQFETSENYEEFLKIIKEKKIQVRVVEEGSKILVEKDLFFDVLWPNSNKIVSDNSMNNNALVCKLTYKDFTMLFTGDIELEAEKVLVSKYKDTKTLKASILKVGHHGSKTSSTPDFLNLIKPKIAFIGVGKNNTFGHPNEEVLQRLKNLRSEDISN